jgi:hypothetical protein
MGALNKIMAGNTGMQSSSYHPNQSNTEHTKKPFSCCAGLDPAAKRNSSLCFDVSV